MPARRPLVLTAVSAVLFGLMAFFAKLAAARLPAGEIAFFRFAVMLVPVLTVPRLLRRALTFERVDLLLYRGVFGGLAVICYFLALTHIPVGIATLLNYSSPIWSVAFAALFLGERVDRRLVVPLAAALSGMALAAGGGQRAGTFLSLGPWHLVGIGSAVLSGAALAAVRAARRSEGSWAIYGSFSLFGLLCAAPLAWRGFRTPSLREDLLLVGVGICSLAAQLLVTYAYRWVTNLQAGVLSQLTVVLSLLLGVGFLGDRLTPLQICGCLLTLGGVIGVIGLQSTPRAVE